MAKSGQKKAFVEETVQNDLPEKELTLSQRPDYDLASTIQAEAYNTGAFPNSSFWNDLSAISQDIHATRRHGNLMNAQVDLKKREYENEFDAFKYERISKSNNDILLARRKIEFEAELQDLIERTKREGGSVANAVSLFRENYLNNFDDNLRLSGEFSPYAYDNLYRYIDSNTSSALKNAITYDYETIETQNKAVMGTAVSTGLTYLYKGTDSNGQPFTTVETGMDYLSNVIGPNLKYIKESDEEALANDWYNSLVLMRAHKEKDIYEADPLNYPDGYQGFINNIQSLAAQYGEQRMWDFATGDEDNPTKSLAVALTPQTLAALSSMTAKTPGKDKAISKAIAAASDFDNYVDYKAISEGRYSDSEFLKRNSIGELNALVGNYVNPLIYLVAQGEEKAITELNKIGGHYVDVKTLVFILDALRQAKADGKDLASVVLDMQNRFSSALRLAKDYGNRAGSEPMDSLIFHSSNGQTINMNLPSPGEDKLLDAYFDSKGGDPDASRRNYVTKVAQGALNFLEKNSMSDLLLFLNSDFSDGLKDFNAYTRVENITKASQVEEGRVVPDASKYNEASGMLSQLYNVQLANTPGFEAHTLTTEIIKSKTSELANAPLDTRLATYEAMGRIMAEANLQDTFKAGDLEALNKAQQETAQNIAMWSYLSKNDILYQGYGTKVRTYFQNRDNVQTSLKGANNFTEGYIQGVRGDDRNLSSTIDAYLSDYNVPVKDRPFLRYTMMHMACASTAGDKERTKFDASAFDDLLSSLYSKTGVALNSPLLANNNLTAQDVDSMKTNIDKSVVRSYKKLNMPDSITTQFNNDTGKLDILINGQPASMRGEYGRGELAGTGRIPMSYSLTNKPAGMDQGKFERGIEIEAEAGLLMLPIANANSKAEALKYIERYAGADNSEKVMDDVTLMFATAMNKDVQDRWQDARHTNFKNYNFMSSVPAETMRTLSAVRKAERNARRPKDTAVGRIVDKALDKAVNDTGVVGAAFTVPYISWQLYNNADVPLKDIPRNVADALSGTKAGDAATNVSKYALTPGSYTARELAKYENTRIDRDITDNEFNQYVRFLYNEAHSGNKPTTSVATTLLYSAVPPGFKAKPNEQKNLTYFADVVIPEIAKNTGVPKLTVSSRYRADDPGSHHFRGTACDIATNNLSRQEKMAVFAEVLKVANISKIGTSDPDLLSVFGSDSNSKNYNPMVQDLTEYDRTHKFRGKKSNHINHFHVTMKPDAETGLSGKGVSSASDFVRAASSVIRDNVDGKVGYIDNQTATFLPQALPNYQPSDWVKNKMGITPSDTFSNPMLNMVALGTEYCWMKSVFGAGREDLALAAVAGAKFKVIPTSKGTKDTRSLKLPDRSLTGEEVFKLMSSGVFQDTFRFSIDEKDSKYGYVRNVLRSAKKSNIISMAY